MGQAAYNIKKEAHWLRRAHMLGRMAHLGYYHYIDTERIVGIAPPHTAAMRGLIKQYDPTKIIIMTTNRRRRSYIFLDDGKIIVSAVSPKTLVEWMGGNVNAKELGEEARRSLTAQDD